MFINYMYNVRKVPRPSFRMHATQWHMNMTQTWSCDYVRCISGARGQGTWMGARMHERGLERMSRSRTCSGGREAREGARACKWGPGHVGGGCSTSVGPRMGGWELRCAKGGQAMQKGPDALVGGGRDVSGQHRAWAQVSRYGFLREI